MFARCRHTYAKLKAQEPTTLQQPAGVQVASAASCISLASSAMKSAVVCGRLPTTPLYHASSGLHHPRLAYAHKGRPKKNPET